MSDSAHAPLYHEFTAEKSVANKCLSGSVGERSVPILSCGTAMDRGGVICDQPLFSGIWRISEKILYILSVQNCPDSH